MKKIFYADLRTECLTRCIRHEYLLWTKEYKYNVEGSFNEALRLRAQGEDVVPLLFPHLYISKNSGSPFLPLSGPSRANMVGVNEKRILAKTSNRRVWFQQFTGCTSGES